jgi:Ca2+-binding RTX toxin-like protein
MALDPVATGSGHPEEDGMARFYGTDDDDTMSFLEISRGVDTSPSGLDATTNGDDEIYGYGGEDYVDASEGDDYIDGGGSADTLQGYSDHDTIYGGNGADRIYGDWSEDEFVAGDDFLYGQDGKDTIYGGRGTDWLDGGDERDKLVGERGDDYLTGGEGRDDLKANEGDDTLLGGRDGDLLIGGDGEDIFVFRSTKASRPGHDDGHARWDTIGPTSRSADTPANAFQVGDRIDLMDIDANERKSGDQDFDWGGVYRKGTDIDRGTLYVEDKDGDTCVLASTDGSDDWDLKIAIDDGSRHADWYITSDFYL